MMVLLVPFQIEKSLLIIYNLFENSELMIFNNNNKTGNTPNPFGGGQGQTQNSNPFSQNQGNQGQTTQNNPLFNNQQGGGGTNTPFQTGGTQGTSPFGNQGATGQGTGNMFQNKPTGGNQTNPFGGQTGGQTGTGNQIFNTPGQSNPYSQGQGGQGGNPLFSQGQGGNTLFSQGQGGNQLFNQTQPGNPYSQNPPGSVLPNLEQDAIAYGNHLQSIKNQLHECLNRLNVHALDYMRVEPTNMYKDQHINKLPLKNESVEILKNFKILKKRIENIRKRNMDIEKKSINYINETHKKLTRYKECLLQTTSQTKLISEVNAEINMMNQQIQDFFKPLYNSYKMKKPVALKDPDQFTLKISYDILNRMNLLNQRIDDLQACENEVENEEISDTVAVFEQLIQYYENVSCSFKDFMSKYNMMKKLAIQKEKRGSYEVVMSRVHEKVTENLNKQFKYYDLIKEVDEILEKREKREEKKKYEERISLSDFKY